ncbi:MAG: hypothetical protein E7277_04375 [Lachnospiraceae bacterium]|nr:hypothetical protein [Lachnospiraceae bacterium]
MVASSKNEVSETTVQSIANQAHWAQVRLAKTNILTYISQGENKMTKKLYDDMPYENRFEAKIVCIKEEKGKKLIELDQTLFFPEEGGQSPDTGTLAGIPVEDVQIKEGIIWHTLPVDADLKEGQCLQGEIDFAHRYDLMQHHSGEHLFSGLVYGKYGYNNVGFHLTEEIMTVDYSGPLTEEQLWELEKEANKIIWQNRPIICEYPNKEVLDKTDYRSKKEIDGAIRLVTVTGVDVCACCAPHVKTTGEVGVITITNWENYKGGIRITLCCGQRAVAYGQQNRSVIKEAMKTLSVKAEEVPEAIARLKEEIATLKTEKAELLSEVIAGKVKEVEAAPVLLAFEKGYDANAQRQLMNSLGEKAERLAAVLVETDTDTYRYMMASETIDVKALQGNLKEMFAAKGGGKPPMIQGTLVGKKEEIAAFLKEV